MKNTYLKRKMLAARSDLADKISEIAVRRGTLYDYVNDILEQAVRADSMGLNLSEVLDDMWVLKAARGAGLTFVSEKLLYDLVEKAYRRLGKKELQDLWYETGQWYGRYYSDLDKFEETTKKLLTEISDLKISKDDKDRLSLTCLSSKFTEAYTELFSKFLEGVLDALGYVKDGGEVAKGMINLRFRKLKGL